MNSKPRIPRSMLLILLLTTPLACTYAAKPVVKEYTFDISDIDKIEINASVGSIHVIPASGKKISVVLEITQQNRHWFQSDIDLAEVELHSSTRGKRLALRQNDDDLNIDWTVELPAVEQTSIELGVGKIEGKLKDTKLHVNLGVGDVELSMPLETTGEINLNTGVGGAKLRGGEARQHKHSFVSQDVDGHGNGDHDVRVKVGVGQVELRLEAAAKL